MKLNIPNLDTTAAGDPTIIYDANGNRVWLTLAETSSTTAGLQSDAWPYR